MGRIRPRAALVDVGGTLIPDRLPQPPGVRRVREVRLAVLLPELDPNQVSGLLDDLVGDAEAARNHLEQRTDDAIADRLGRTWPELRLRAPDVRRALGRHTGHEHPPFPGHRALLQAAGDLGLRRVIVSNTDFTSAEDWLRWRAPAIGIAGLLDGVVTSYDARHRKPHRDMFDRALRAAGCAPDACVFIGDKERKDVEPALALGMTVIRVAIQEPAGRSRAGHVATTLEEAAGVLRELCA